MILRLRLPRPRLGRWAYAVRGRFLLHRLGNRRVLSRYGPLLLGHARRRKRSVRPVRGARGDRRRFRRRVTRGRRRRRAARRARGELAVHLEQVRLDDGREVRLPLLRKRRGTRRRRLLEALHRHRVDGVGIRASGGFFFRDGSRGGRLAGVLGVDAGVLGGTHAGVDTAVMLHPPSLLRLGRLLLLGGILLLLGGILVPLGGILVPLGWIPALTPPALLLLLLLGLHVTQAVFRALVLLLLPSAVPDSPPPRAPPVPASGTDRVGIREGVAHGVGDVAAAAAIGLKLSRLGTALGLKISPPRGLGRFLGRGAELRGAAEL